MLSRVYAHEELMRWPREAPAEARCEGDEPSSQSAMAVGVRTARDWGSRSRRGGARTHSAHGGEASGWQKTAMRRPAMNAFV